MAFYAQHDNSVEADAFKQQRERDELFKTLQQYQDLIRIKLSIWVRNGPSAALRQDIEEAAFAYGMADKQLDRDEKGLDTPLAK